MEEGWKDRLKQEYIELTERQEKLSLFLSMQEQKQTIDDVSHALLVAQHGAMTAYQAILWTRISTSIKVSE
jgi:hypothetical protein